MSDRKLKLEVVTPAGIVLDEQVDAVYVVTNSGSMGFLPDHAPLIAALVPHVLRYTINGVEDRIFVSRGMVEVLDNVVHILTNAAEAKSAIDFARAEAARERALQRLHSQTNIDHARAEAALNRANARLSLRRTGA